MKNIDPAQLAVVARAVKSAIDSIDRMHANIMRLELTPGATPILVGLVSDAVRIKSSLDLADVYLSFDAGDRK